MYKKRRRREEGADEKQVKRSEALGNHRSAQADKTWSTKKLMRQDIKTKGDVSKHNRSLKNHARKKTKINPNTKLKSKLHH